ncbi:MAG: nucleoside kinase [Spirochaetales bacterium]|nr:nucleoside kinase [Spirochaetales bacterium]
MTDVHIRMPSGETRDFPYGTPVSALVRELAKTRNQEDEIIAALIDNELVSLSYKLKFNATFKPVRIDSPIGMSTYKRSLCFLLTIAAREIFPERTLVIGHSFGDGYYYSFTGPEQINDADILLLDTRIRDIVSRNLPIERGVISYTEAIQYFESHGQTATARLLDFRNENKTAVTRCGEFMDLAHFPLVPFTGVLDNFQLHRYGAGFVLRFPANRGQESFPPFQGSPVLYSIYQEYKNWGKILNVASVGQLNRISDGNNIRDFIDVAEALHNKKITRIADSIYERGKDIRIILIAGPSSSGKTTFTKKLAIDLTVHGYIPVTLAMDDYFLPREQTPRGEDGNYDFEAITALDVELLNKHLLALFAGEEIEIPSFDFKTGKRKTLGASSLRLPKNGILLMEGIHGLNDKLTPLVPAGSKFRIYVSALTQLNLDEHNRVSTTVNRLIRRIVRDHQFRGHPAHTTLAMWPSVRQGEDKNIFPFQDSADACFNSALDYELGVLKPIAQPILRTIKPGQESYHEALRLLSFLEFFIPIPVKYVPPASILREFVGDSSFKY